MIKVQLIPETAIRKKGTFMISHILLKPLGCGQNKKYIYRQCAAKQQVV
jgi:hypothetical protein